jgi:hypothetical protein
VCSALIGSNSVLLGKTAVGRMMVFVFFFSLLLLLLLRIRLHLLEALFDL